MFNKLSFSKVKAKTTKMILYKLENELVLDGKKIVHWPRMSSIYTHVHTNTMQKIVLPKMIRQGTESNRMSWNCLFSYISYVDRMKNKFF